MSDDSKLETALKNLSIQDNQYLKDLKEKTYRQVANSARQARDRPFNYLEYPLLRNRIVRRDEREYDLMPGMYLNYPDPEGDIRDMASNVMGKKLRNKLTMRKDRLKFATDKLYLAKLINKGIISEDIARKVARSRFNLKGGTNNSELTDEQEIKDEFLSGIQPAWKSEPIIPRNNYSAFLKHITDLPFDLQDMVGNTRDKLVKEKIEELKDIKTANAYFIKKLTSKYITRLRLFYNLEKNIKKYKKNVNKDLIFKKIRYDKSYISEINELFSFDDYKVSEIFVKILIELSDALLPGENTTLEFLLQYIYDNARIYLLIDIFEKYLTTDDSIDTKIKIEKNLKKILIMLDLQ